MIRIETAEGWLLMTHQNHARLAGAFGKIWGNDRLIAPEPLEDILVAVSRHDDAWSSRDANPLITPEGTPSAFSKELVGTYSAFENIDLEAYLAVRGAATEAVAGDNPLAAVLISMHTVNLLTEQADLSSLADSDRRLHAAFIRAQLDRQEELKSQLPSDRLLTDADWQRAFKFLQCCDSFSLTVCVGYPTTIPLRHEQPTAVGELTQVLCEPQGNGSYSLAPYPLATDEYVFDIPAIQIAGKTFSSNEALQEAYANGQPEIVRVTVHR